MNIYKLERGKMEIIDFTISIVIGVIVKIWKSSIWLLTMFLYFIHVILKK